MKINNKIIQALLIIGACAIGSITAGAQTKPEELPQTKVLTREEVRGHLAIFFQTLLGEKDAGVAAETLITHITGDDVMPFYPISELCHCTATGLENASINVTRALRGALSLARDPLLITRWEELRFLPSTLDRSAIAVIVRPGDAFTADKISKIIAMAKLKQISISIMMSADKNGATYDETVKKELLRLAGESSGVVVDLSGEGRPVT